MQSLIVIDVETTGLDPKTEKIIEVGAVLYSIEHRTVVSSFSMLSHADANAAEKINRIPADALREAPSLQCSINRIGDLIDIAECSGDVCFVAHRATFDRGFIEASAPKLAARIPWVCSKFDIVWPMSKPGASCVEMALAHGVPVVSAHRALTDCMLIAKTCEEVQAAGHDLAAMIAKALRPKVEVVADTPKPWDMPEAEWTDLKGRLLASGFQFINERKAWVGRIAKDDIAGLGFRVREVSP